MINRQIVILPVFENTASQLPVRNRSPPCGISLSYSLLQASLDQQDPFGSNGEIA